MASRYRELLKEKPFCDHFELPEFDPTLGVLFVIRFKLKAEETWLTSSKEKRFDAGSLYPFIAPLFRKDMGRSAFLERKAFSRVLSIRSIPFVGKNQTE